VQLRRIFLAVLACVLPAVAAETADHNDLSDYYGFGEMEVIKLDWGVGAMQVVDLNGDGRNDIIAANNRRARIEAFIQKQAIGPGKQEVTVAPEDFEINDINLPTRFDSQPIPVSERIYSLASGDLNGDGMRDLIYYGDPKGLYVILQKTGEVGADGRSELSWRMPKKIKIDDGLLTAYALVCADLNNDGRDDIALASRDGVYFVAQEADGTLAEPVKYPTTSMPKAIRATDLNGDKVKDLLMLTDDVDRPVSVRFGSADGRLGPQEQFACETPWAMELFDIDNSGTDEMLIVDNVSWRLLCYELTTEDATEGDWPILFYPLAAGEGASKRDLAAADVDGDGRTDIVISDPGAAELILYRQLPQIGLGEPKRFPALADISKISAADIDGDGKAELAVLSVKEKIIGISRFEKDRLTFPKPLEVVDEPVAMDLADVDGDSHIDCVYVSRDANDARWLHVLYDVASYSSDNNTMPAREGLELLEKRSADPALKLEKLVSNPDGIKVLDADRDGLSDVLVFDKYNPPPLFVRQVEKGKFELVDSTSAQSSLIKDATPSSIAVADIDHKDGPELLVAQDNFARSLVFQDSRIWRVVDQYNAKSTENSISTVAAFYLSGLGLTDKPAILLLDGSKGQLQILTPDKDGTYRFEKELDVGRWNPAPHLKMLHESVSGADAKSIVLFDGEKFAIITPPSAEHPARRLEQLFSYETKIKDGAYGQLALGDINSDGRPDIVMVEYKGNHIEILALDADYKPVPAMRFKLFEQKNYRDSDRQSVTRVEPRELAIADVTGDGKNDLVTLIHDRIIIYPQD
jgi:hypothetical protein